MLRLVFFLVQIIALITAALWLRANTSDLSITVSGREIVLNSGLALILAVLVIALAYFLLTIGRQFLNLPARQRRKREEAKNKKGLEAITKGLSAIAAGDLREANKQRATAEKFLAQSPLTHLVSAQTALLEGDDDKATDKFTAMLEDKDAAFMGLRGLINQAMKRGDRSEALELLRQAFQLRPATLWVVDTLFRLEAAEGSWNDALAVIEQARKKGLFTQSESKVMQSAILTQIARIQRAAGDMKTAQDSVTKAQRLDPSRVPAVLTLAELLAVTKSEAAAQRLLAQAWRVDPHPLVSQAFIKASVAQAPEQILEAVKTLTSRNKDHPLSILELGRANLACQNLIEARRLLTLAVEVQPSHQAYMALVALEQAEGASFAEVNAVQAKAMLYPRRDSWVCSACYEEQLDWTAICPSCESFDAMTWGQIAVDGSQPLLLEQRMASKVGLLEQR